MTLHFSGMSNEATFLDLSAYFHSFSKRNNNKADEAEKVVVISSLNCAKLWKIQLFFFSLNFSLIFDTMKWLSTRCKSQLCHEMKT